MLFCGSEIIIMYRLDDFHIIDLITRHKQSTTVHLCDWIEMFELSWKHGEIPDSLWLPYKLKEILRAVNPQYGPW